MKTLRQKLDQLEGAPDLKDLQLRESLREGLRRYLHSYCANADGRVTIKSVMERTGVDEIHAAQIIKTAKLDKDLY